MEQQKIIIQTRTATRPGCDPRVIQRPPVQTGTATRIVQGGQQK